MIKDSSKGLFDIVIVWKLDRFARNRYDSAFYKATLKKNNVKVMSATENISEGADGILLEAILEGFAEYYSVELAEKIKRGMTENALKLRSNGVRAPIGYYIDEEKHFQNQIRNPIVPKEQLLFALYNYRKLDMSVQSDRQKLIDSFVNSIYLYDDHFIITFNYKNTSKKVSLKEINSSSLTSSTPPKEKDAQPGVFFFSIKSRNEEPRKGASLFSGFACRGSVAYNVRRKTGVQIPAASTITS